MADETTAESNEPAELTAYDRIPYASYPFVQTHPRRLATIGRLGGMRPADVESCRVLELACAAGGNLIPLAEQIPGGHFVGVDASRVQIDTGRKIVAELGLKNVDLRHADILEIGPDFGEFDYIIAHGVYSWVPPAVQEKILDVCQRHLSPQGIAYISYNTNPGWRLRGTIRDVMRYRAKQFQNPKDQIQQSLALVRFLAKSLSVESPYGHMLNVELKGILKSQGYYLLHEYLEDVNEALYFHEFIERATPKRLQYLGEAEYWSSWLNNFGPDMSRALRALSSDIVQMEQYMDFVRNRTFRQTLLCHDNVTLSRAPKAEQVLDMYVWSEAKPAVAVTDLLNRESVRFARGKAGVSTEEPMLKAVMQQLLDNRPAWTSFRDLIHQAKTRVALEAASQGKGEPNFVEEMRVAEMMLHGFATNVVELSTSPYPMSLEPGDRPVASPLARLQARSDMTVTNRQHTLTTLNGFQQFAIQKLDGKHFRADIVDVLYAESRETLVLTNADGQKLTAEDEVKAILSKLLDDTLRFLASNGLLIAAP